MLSARFLLVGLLIAAPGAGAACVGDAVRNNSEKTIKEGKRCCFDDLVFETGITATGTNCKAGEWVRPKASCTIKKDDKMVASTKCGFPVAVPANGKFEVSCSSAKGKFSTSYSDCEGAKPAAADKAAADKAAADKAAADKAAADKATGTTKTLVVTTKDGKAEWKVGEYEPLAATVGDKIVFNYGTTHDVMKMNDNSCTKAVAIELAKNDVAGGSATLANKFTYTVTAADLTAKTIYFACSYSPAASYSHCKAGQKLTVNVGEAAKPAATGSTTAKPAAIPAGTANSAPPTRSWHTVIGMMGLLSFFA